jgi:hypothetical protein
MKYFKWYVGSDLDLEVLCEPCASRRDQGIPAEVIQVCEECYRRITVDYGDLAGARGSPGIRERLQPLDVTLRKTSIPAESGTVSDLAPIAADRRSLWLLLLQDGKVVRLDADTGEIEPVGLFDFAVEPAREPWCGRAARKRLHASKKGEYAAVVTDYGRYGQVLDLRSGKATLALDGGDYHSETVPFSFAFAEVDGRTIAVHRTAWNRLDLSDPSTGQLLSSREPTSYTRDEPRPKHYLDYFHGELHVSPDHQRILDDGWVWHPVGIPKAWSLDRWLMDNPWESEDGPSNLNVCGREYYWGHGMTWLDGHRVAVGGIGDDELEIVPGARIFEADTAGPPSGDRWSEEWTWAKELRAFPGPTGRFFSDGIRLFSADQTGLSVWDPERGERIGRIPGFCPTHLHPVTKDLACVSEGALLRWKQNADPRDQGGR